MLIESNKPVAVELTEKLIQLSPGKPIEFPDDIAERLVKKAPHTLRVVEHSAPSFAPGAALIWDSPRFGTTTVRALDSIGEWFFVQGIQTKGLMAWVRGEHLTALHDTYRNRLKDEEVVARDKPSASLTA